MKVLSSLAIAMCGSVIAPGTVAARDCAAAEIALAQVLEVRDTSPNSFNGTQFLALPDSSKWFWTTRYLSAQMTRVRSILAVQEPVDPMVVRREARVLIALDDAEPCYREAVALSSVQAGIPNAEERAQLRTELEVFE